MIYPNDDQQLAIDSIYEWFYNTNKSMFKLGGYAGTGKTSLIPLIVSSLSIKDVAYLAYTGKAASVLKTKLPSLHKHDFCGTIHQFMYTPIIDEKTKKIKGWYKKEVLSDQYSLIIVDESSMVPNYILKDLLSFKIKILFIGDCYQLPPIDDKFELMECPDYTLTKIHRQAEDNPIIKLSMIVRDNGNIPFGVHGYNPPVVKVPKNSDLKGKFLKSTPKDFLNTMILVGRNSTRKMINSKIRQYLGHVSKLPKVGDKVICLKNNYKSGLINGLVGRIEHCDLWDNYLGMEVWLPDQKEYYFGPVSKDVFYDKDHIDFNQTVEWIDINQNSCDLEKQERQIDFFDYGYCTTVHKAQGSQADRVMVIEERFYKMSDEDWSRWLYTSITRSTKQLLILG